MTLFKGVIQRITDSAGANGVTSASVLADNAIVQGAGGARGVDSNATGNRVTKGWFTDIETTNAPSINGVAASGSGAIALVTGATLAPVSVTASTVVNSGVSALVDGATPALNAALGNTFTLSAGGDRTIAVPSNAVSGQRIVIEHTASGSARTLALNSGAGGFRFGSDITGLTQTASGKTDYIGCIYNGGASFWDVVAYAKGY